MYLSMVEKNPNLQTTNIKPFFSIMEEVRFVNPKENPRPLSFPRDRVPINNNISPKPLLNEAAQKSPPPVMDRFRAMLKDRDDEIRVSDEDDDVPPPSSEEIVRLYELLLSELTVNSKPIITDLTIIAGEQREHGEGIADAICARIIEVPVEQKLPSLYLLDSIVKNIGGEYVHYFSSRLPEVFCEAYRQVHPSLYPAMRHLFGTWFVVFPHSVLRKIEAQLQFSPAVKNQSSGLTSLTTPESPRPTHGIHVNPKYLEARRQFDNSTADNHTRGTSSNMKMYGPKHSGGYDEYDADQAELTSSKIGAQIFSSTDIAGRASLGLGTNKLLPSSTARLMRQPSPSNKGLDKSSSLASAEHAADSSPGWLVERGSPSHPGFDYGLGRAIGRDKGATDWRRKRGADDSYQQFKAPAAYNPSNGSEHQRPKALIDAYGSDRRISNDKPWKDKPMKVEHLDINGIDSKIATKSWQNTEEEEYDWEDMSPTLADRGRTNDFPHSSVPPLGSFRSTPDYGMSSAARLESDFRSNWSSRAQPTVGDSSIVAEDAVPNLSSGRGTMSKIPGFQNGRNQGLGSHYSQEAWNPMYHQPQSSGPLLNAKGRGKKIQMPLLASGMSSSVGDRKPSLIGNLQEADAQLRRPPIIPSRMASSGVESMNLEVQSAGVLASSGAWPPVTVHTSQPFNLLSVPSHQKQTRGQYNTMNASDAVMMQGPVTSIFMPEQQQEGFDNRTFSSTKLPQLPNQQGGVIPLDQQSQAQVSSVRPHFSSQDNRRNLVVAAVPSVSSYSVTPPLNHGYTPQGHGSASSTVLSNPVPGVYLPALFNNMPNSSFQIRGGSFPPLPPGLPPASSQIITPSQHAGSIVTNQPPGRAYSGLISSLMAQGLISFAKQPTVQDSVGLEFNVDILKVRHESAIIALYGNLPRQCTTCGLRFKCQEEHSSHMDWHVTKNRINKNRKQKPSRKWFVSASMWLSGAEALGTDAVPGFLPTEITVEKDDEEMAVPADEDQNVCALCGEPFDDFYSDETEEWMYRGAVYLNAPNGSMAGLDRSVLGPIVHAKCRSESNVVSSENFGQDEGGNTEDGSQRKRMRS